MRNQIDNMLVTASWFEEFKRNLGIEGVSQVWGDRPAWYFWISGAPGVYLFQLEDCAEEPTCGGARGVFAVKCYPYPGTDIFRGFAFEERCLAESDRFDHTHTPRAEAREEIPESLFNVAAIECLLGTDASEAVFTLESLDRMRIRHEAESRRICPVCQRGESLQPGAVARDVMAWELAYPLFDRLVSLFAHFKKRKPGRVRMTRAPGFEYVSEGPDQFSCRETGTVGLYSLSVLFPAKSGQEIGSVLPLPVADADAPEGELIFEHLSTCGHFHPPPSSVPLIGHLNSDWWALAEANFKSEVASTCGCDHAH